MLGHRPVRSKGAVAAQMDRVFMAQALEPWPQRVVTKEFWISHVVFVEWRGKRLRSCILSLLKCCDVHAASARLRRHETRNCSRRARARATIQACHVVAMCAGSSGARGWEARKS